MAQLQSELRGFAEVDQALANIPGEIKEALADVLNETGEAGRDAAKRALRQKTSSAARGHLVKTVRVSKPATVEDLEVVVSAGRDASVFYPYEFAVEFGARPHFPRVERVTGKTERLDRWVRRMNPSPRTQEQRQMDPEELREEVAYLIARKFSQVGIDEQPFMRPGFRVAKVELRKQLRTIKRRVET